MPSLIIYAWHGHTLYRCFKMYGLCIMSVSCTGEELNERVEVLGRR